MAESSVEKLLRLTSVQHVKGHVRVDKGKLERVHAYTRVVDYTKTDAPDVPSAAGLLKSINRPAKNKRESINVSWDLKQHNWKMKSPSKRRPFRPDEPHIYQDSWHQELETKDGKTVPSVVDTSPPNPSVKNLDSAIHGWLVGRSRGGASFTDYFPWWREIRTEFAKQVGVKPLKPYDSKGDYIMPSAPPKQSEIVKDATALVEGIRKAPPAQPGLWRGLSPHGFGGGEPVGPVHRLQNMKPGRTLTMLPGSWSRDPARAKMYAYGSQEDPGIMFYVVPGSKGVKDRKRLLGDEEVITAGKFKVLNVEKTKGLVVITLQQTEVL